MQVYHDAAAGKRGARDTRSSIGPMLVISPWNHAHDDSRVLYAMIRDMLLVRAEGDMKMLHAIYRAQMELRQFAADEDGLTLCEALFLMERCNDMDLSLWSVGIESLRAMIDDWSRADYSVDTSPLWDFLADKRDAHGNSHGLDLASFRRGCELQAEIYERIYKEHVFDQDAERPSLTDPDEHARELHYWGLMHTVKRVLDSLRAKFQSKREQIECLALYKRAGLVAPFV